MEGDPLLDKTLTTLAGLEPATFESLSAGTRSPMRSPLRHRACGAHRPAGALRSLIIYLVITTVHFWKLTLLRSLRKFEKHRNKTTQGTHNTRRGEFLILPATTVLCLCNIRTSLIKDQKPHLISSGQGTDPLAAVGFAKWNLGTSRQAASEDFPSTWRGRPRPLRLRSGVLPRGREAPLVRLERAVVGRGGLRGLSAQQTTALRPSESGVRAGIFGDTPGVPARGFSLPPLLCAAVRSSRPGSSSGRRSGGPGPGRRGPACGCGHGGETPARGVQGLRARDPRAAASCASGGTCSGERSDRRLSLRRFRAMRPGRAGLGPRPARGVRGLRGQEP